MNKFQFFLIIILIPFASKAQSYHPLYVDSTIYRVDYPVGILGFCVGNAASYQYEFPGDTIINGIIYKKINKSGFIYIPQCYNGTPLGYQGALREDSIQRKVFLIKAGNTNEDLLYDFNLNIGDTIHSLLIDPNGCGDVIIDYIDSTLINNIWCKRWQSFNLGCQPVGTLMVESIGSWFGLIDYYQQFEGGPSLECVTKNGNVIFSKAGGPCNTIGLPALFKNDSPAIAIKDNLNSLEFTKSKNDSGIETIQFFIFSSLGNEIFSDQFTDSYIFEKDQCPSGLLLIKFYNKREVIQINKSNHIKL